MAKNTGKLLKGGEADYNNVCKQIITDWQRGRIPYHTKAPIDPNMVKHEEPIGEVDANAAEVADDAEFEKDE